ncbi:MAG: bifunctional tetrahydrofolate synthase/dihydrofolate synthase [Dokdonella sp.]
MSMHLDTLAQWLDYQQRIHPREIELGLGRIREVWQRLGAPRLAPLVISVAGTNGKGSTVALLEAMLQAMDLRVGAFTSPHLLRYNERVRVAGHDADDASLVAAFARIEQAREAIPLTYFEFGTLAAFLVFAESSLDIVLLEVGLGGRLDAVNLIDADAAVVTTIDLDHQDWLGDDRDHIGAEKAGISRPGRAVIVGDSDPPPGLLNAVATIGADLRLAGRDFCMDAQPGGWQWHALVDGVPEVSLELPNPALAAPCQMANAASAIATLYALRDRLSWNPAAMAVGVGAATLVARMQRFALAPELVVDVAHNAQAARVLAQWLLQNPIRGRTVAVFGALADKDVAAVVAPLAEHFSSWHLAGLDSASPRGLSADALRERLPLQTGLDIAGGHASVEDALQVAMDASSPQDRVIAFGSFFVAAAVLAMTPLLIAERAARLRCGQV